MLDIWVFLVGFGIKFGPWCPLVLITLYSMALMPLYNFGRKGNFRDLRPFRHLIRVMSDKKTERQKDKKTKRQKDKKTKRQKNKKTKRQ